MNTFGVSPALFLSLYGQDFTPGDVMDGLELVKRLGFDCFQGEVVHAGQLDAWLNGGARDIRGRAAGLGLSPSQFVAHFMMDAFSDNAALDSDFGFMEMETVTRICDHFGQAVQITVPMGRFQETAPNLKALINKLGRIAGTISRAGHRMALEVQPGAMIQGAEAIKGCIQSIGLNCGYNFDTGHAWASGCKNITEFPAILGQMIYGTHLCDNDSVTNDSLTPGKGSIAWDKLIPALSKSGYPGSYDLEIFCDKVDVPAAYSQGLAYIKALL